MPSMMAVNMVNNNAIIGAPPEREIIDADNLEPSPVMDNTAEMMPAAAHAAEIGIAALTPIGNSPCCLV